MRRSIRACVGTVVIGLLAAPFSGATTTPKPDLRCAELSAERVQTTEVPLRVKVHLKVQNFGPGNSESFVSRLSYRKGSSGPFTTVREFPSPFTPPNGGAVWNPTVDLTQGGTYTFKVEVDVNGEVAEKSEGNNSKSVTKALAGGTPDLTVTDVDAQIIRTTSSGTISTKVTWSVENVGDGKAAGSFVTVVKVSKNGGSFVELARFTRSNLAAGARAQFTKSQSFTGVTKLKFRVETDATNAIHELANSNNSADSGVLQP